MGSWGAIVPGGQANATWQLTRAEKANVPYYIHNPYTCELSVQTLPVSVALLQACFFQTEASRRGMRQSTMSEPIARKTASMPTTSLEFYGLYHILGWSYMQGTPAVLYAGHVQISVRTVLHGMVLSKLLFWSKSFFLFYNFYWPASTTYWYCASPPPCFPNR